MNATLYDFAQSHEKCCGSTVNLILLGEEMEKSCPFLKKHLQHKY